MTRFGVSKYADVYEAQFVKNLRLYSAVRKQIKRRVERALANPYENAEFLGDISGKLTCAAVAALAWIVTSASFT